MSTFPVAKESYGAFRGLLDDLSEKPALEFRIWKVSILISYERYSDTARYTTVDTAAKRPFGGRQSTYISRQMCNGNPNFNP